MTKAIRISLIGLASLLGLYLFISLGLYFAQESLLFMATKLEQDYQFDFEQDFEELFLKTPDGAVLNLIHFKAENPKGAIVYYHGNMGDNSRWGELVQPLMKYNYDIYLMDYRGYGKSTGTRSSSKMYSDAELVYKQARAQFRANDIVLFGRSLGAAFATYVASRQPSSQLILETPFYSLRNIVEPLYPFFPVKKLLEFHLPSFQYLPQVNSPILILHGTRDKVVPFENGQMLDSLSKQSQLIVIKGGRHNNLADYDYYWKALDRCFEKLEKRKLNR